MRLHLIPRRLAERGGLPTGSGVLRIDAVDALHQPHLGGVRSVREEERGQVRATSPQYGGSARCIPSHEARKHHHVVRAEGGEQRARIGRYRIGIAEPTAGTEHEPFDR